jgi:acetyltransferase-like isoleucine patch superfamily enzyme/glycosyltransferase involved in cell wall biosynthesis
MMDANAVCFITKVQNEDRYMETLKYIQALTVPEGMRIETIGIRGADTPSVAYERARQQTNAKYKVYFHEGLFIIDKEFIARCLTAFDVQPSPAMLGVIGSAGLPVDGNWKRTNSLRGLLYETEKGVTRLRFHDSDDIEHHKIVALDGILIITQFDLPWKQTLFAGFHYAELSYCIEYTRKGYTLDVLSGEQPLCLYDAGEQGRSNAGNNSDLAVFLKEFDLFKDIYGNLFYHFGVNSVMDISVTVIGSKNISIGNEVWIQNDCILAVPQNRISDHVKLSIMDGCEISQNVTITASNKVTIEKNVRIEAHTIVSDMESEFRKRGIPTHRQGVNSNKNIILIGEGSHIGMNCVIKGNLVIGKGCVIQPNSVVSEDIPDYCIAAGNPAKVIQAYDAKTGLWQTIQQEAELTSLLQYRELAPPFLTIAIPTYNRADILDACLESIFSQIGNDPNIEVLIVNNDSPDHTEQVALSHRARYNNLRYMRNDRNINGDPNIWRSAQEAVGQFILWHGDDDYFLPNTIYDVYNFVDRNRHCGLFFLNLQKPPQESTTGAGLIDYLTETSIHSSFISSIILNKNELSKVENPTRFLDSSLNQTYLQYCILQQNPNYGIRYGPMFHFPADVGGGAYNYAKVFIQNYLEILKYFENAGLTAESISIEKKRMLERHLLTQYNFLVRNRMSQFEPEKFISIFTEYYKDEPYFQDAYNILMEAHA